MENKLFKVLDENFDKFRNALLDHFKKMCEGRVRLFRVNIKKDTVSKLYLDTIPAEYNPIFRERGFYDCQACLHFIKSFSSVVAIKDDYNIETIWDFKCGVDYFDNVAKVLSDYVNSIVRESKISDIFLYKFDKMGIDHNYEHTEDGSDFEWEHLYLNTPKIAKIGSHADVNMILNYARTKKIVLENSLNSISIEACDIVLELIASESLYKGLDYKNLIIKYKQLAQSWKDVSEKLNALQKDNWLWNTIANESGREINIVNPIFGIKNTAIGTLLIDITNYMDLNEAVTKYERIVAPENYKRPKAIYTANMLERAREEIKELGYLDSLPRRFACLDDIRVNNVIFSNRDVAKKIFGIGEGEAFFDDMEQKVKIVNPKQFSRCEEITIDNFIKNVIPTMKEIDLLFESRLEKNLVSLIAPKNMDSKSMFTWNNGFSWSYKGNITDSSIKANVAKAGGNVVADLRFSIQWNDGDEWDRNDLDAHCVFNHGRNHICFHNKVDYTTGGNLDIDIINPVRGEPSVENITFPNKFDMPDGEYFFVVHCYTNRGGRSGVRAEIEFDGEVYNYDYTQPIRHHQEIPIAKVTKKDGKFTITNLLDPKESKISSKEIWGINTNQFIPVSVILNSPNYWEGEPCKGPKHTFFMLNGCVNNERPNGFFNEYLNDDFRNHRRVMEALGSKAAVEDREDQLSGIGVSYTQHAYVYLHVKGNTERVIKVTF